MKNIILILVLFLLFSCKSKKSYLHTTDIKRDSISYVSSKTILAPILSQLVIKDICDSITGKPRAMSQTFVKGKDTIFVEVGAEGLKIKYAAALDSLKSVYESKKSTEVKISDERKIEHETPGWAWKVMGGELIAILALIIFPVISKFIRGIFIKIFV